MGLKGTWALLLACSLPVKRLPAQRIWQVLHNARCEWHSTLEALPLTISTRIKTQALSRPLAGDPVSYRLSTARPWP